MYNMEEKAIVSRHVYAYSPALCAQELAALHAAHPGETELACIGFSCLGQPILPLGRTALWRWCAGPGWHDLPWCPTL